MSTRAREVAQRLRDYLEPGDLVVGKRMMRHAMSEAADIIEALLAEREWRSMDSAPTAEQIAAGEDAWREQFGRLWCQAGDRRTNGIIVIYEAMVAALPQPPEGEG